MAENFRHFQAIINIEYADNEIALVGYAVNRPLTESIISAFKSPDPVALLGFIQPAYAGRIWSVLRRNGA